MTMDGNMGEPVDGGYRRITAERFARLDFSTVTLLDLREPGEVAADGIEGAVNAPLDPLASVLRTVPKDRPVIVFCREGQWSEEVAEILADRGYDAASLVGGYEAYARLRDWGEA